MKVSVRYFVDRNWIFTVEVEDPATGNVVKTTVNNNSQNLDPELKDKLC